MPNLYYKLNQHGVPDRIYAACHRGNKKRRKAKSTDKWWSCGCCTIDDHRWEILQRIADDEMTDYAGEGYPLD